MEDDVAPGSSGGVSVSPLSEKLRTKPFLENIGGDNKVEESYEEEIMVEVVGSDVFVDGVSCQKEGCLGSGEVRGRNVSEATDVLGEGDVNKIGESEVDVGFSESVGAEGGAVCELSSKDVRVSDDEVWNPRIEATVVTSEILDRPAVEGNIITAEKGGISLSSNNASNLDHSREVSVTSHKAASESDGARFVVSEVSVRPNSECPVSIQAGGTDRAVDKVGLVTATDGVFEADAENGKIVDEKVLAAENKDSILKTDALVSDVQDENQGSLKESHGIKCEPKHGFDDASRASPESSSHERSSVGERMEVKGAEFNGEQLDIKDGAPNITLSHLSCGVSNDECLKNGGDVETDMVHQNHAVSNEPTQQAGGGDTAEVNEDNGLNIEILADTVENQSNMLTSSCPVDTEIVQADSVISDQNVAAFQLKVVDGEGSCEKGDPIDPEISIKCPGSAEIAALDASTENMYLSTEDSCSKVETDDAKVAEHHVTCNDPLVTAELGLDIVVEEYGSSQNMEQEVAVQITESANIPVQITESSNDRVASIDLLPNEVTSIVCDVDTSRDEADAENDKIVDEKVLAAENKDSILKTDALVSDVQDENQGSLKEYNDIKCEPKHGFDDASHASPESSSHERSSVGERMEVKGAEVKDGAPNIALPHLSCGVSNNECLKNGGDVETDMVHQNHAVSNEPALQAGGGDTAEVSEDNGLNIEILADTEENQSNMLTSSYPKNSSESKERSLTELMGVTEYSPDAEDESFAEESVLLSPVKKRKALDHPLPDGYDKRVSIYAAKVSTPMSQTPKPSFKIGECIRRVASQLTGSTSLGKVNNEDIVIDGSPKIYEHSERRSVIFSAESSSVNEMLSKLQLLAQDPKKVHSFLHVIHTFFMGFRSTIALNRRGRKKNADQTPGGSAEDFEFDDVNDSYWTDRIVQNYSEEQRLNNSANGVGNLQIVPFGLEKSVKPGRKPNSRKRYSTGSYPTAATELDENVKRRKQESSPAELILNFAERNSVPSEINLNKMFRRFGPLMESETEVDHESGCAKVIFKRGSDAEVARNSSEKFNIFGPVLVNYQIGYAPLISVKVLPVAIPPPQEDAALML